MLQFPVAQASFNKVNVIFILKAYSSRMLALSTCLFEHIHARTHTHACAHTHANMGAVSN